MTQYVKISKEDQELMHFGVMGMHWGKRTGGKGSSSKRVPTKQLQKSEMRKNFDNAKTKKQDAYDEFSDAYNNFSSNPLNAFSKRGDVKFNKLTAATKKSNQADVDFKNIKIDRNAAIKSKYQDLQGNAKLKEKLTYNAQTRKRAARYIVDNDMSVADATKRAQGDAIRNTAIFLGAYAAVGAATIYAKSR